MKATLLILLLGLAGALQAQAIMDQLPISVLPPRGGEPLTKAQATALTNTVRKVVTANGLSAAGSTQFAVYPSFVVDYTDEVPGLETLYEISGTLTLHLVQHDNQIVFNTVSLEITGMAADRRRSITDALRTVRPSHPDLRDFLRNSKAKILEYYSKQCANLMREAERLYHVNSYEAALAQLLSIPKEADCHARAMTHVQEIYGVYQERRCKSWLQGAETELAANHYEAALRYLSRIDPNSSCGARAAHLIERAGAEVDGRDQRAWRELRQRYREGVALEALQTQVLGDILTAYYTRPDTNVWLIN